MENLGVWLGVWGPKNFPSSCHKMAKSERKKFQDLRETGVTVH